MGKEVSMLACSSKKCYEMAFFPPAVFPVLISFVCALRTAPPQHLHFYLQALYFLSLIAAQTIWTEGQGWIDPPIHTPSVCLLKQKQI